MTKRGPILAGWIAVILVGLFLRFDSLSERPMHFDEATGARILGDWLEKDQFPFRADHFHGPLHPFLGGIATSLRNETTWATFSKSGLRLYPAVAGSLLILTPLLWVRRIGSSGALGAAAFLATSPLLVYYSRMYVHESLLVLLSLIALPIFYRLITRPGTGISLLAGIITGLMWATKETFILFLLACIAGAVAMVIFDRRINHNPVIEFSLQVLIRVVIAFLGGTLLTVFVIYSAGFRHPEGLVEAFKTLAAYETTPGHDKGILYYLKTLILPKWNGRVLWTEGLVLLAAIGSLVVTLRDRECNPSKGNFLAVVFAGSTGLSLFLIYSLIPYKTPWLMVVPWAIICFSAGACFARPLEKKTHQGILILVILLTIAFQAFQSLQSTGRFANDSRNPYAYVPTSPDVEKLSEWLGTLNATAVDTHIENIGIAGSSIWPLPWYLRQFKNVGYWQSAEDVPEDFSVVIAMPDAFAKADLRFSRTHVPLARRLRENFPIVVYLREDIWDAWTVDDSK